MQDHSGADVQPRISACSSFIGDHYARRLRLYVHLEDRRSLAGGADEPLRRTKREPPPHGVAARELELDDAMLAGQDRDNLPHRRGPAAKPGNGVRVRIRTTRSAHKAGSGSV